MRILSNALALALLAMAPAYTALTFVQLPSLAKVNDTTWQASFQVSEATDVEVSIVRLSDSSIIRHLAAGVLGANPPAPFTASSLSQTLSWNGRDDLGMLVADTSNLSVRVRAGMSVDLDRFAGGTPYGFTGALSVVGNKDGYVYICGGSCSPNNYFTTIRRFDAQGNYIRTVYPPPADLPYDRISPLGGHQWASPAGFSPVFTTGRASPQFFNSLGIISLSDISDSGKLYLNTGASTVKINSDGSCGAGDAVPLKLITSPALPGGYNQLGRKYLTLSADGKWWYMSGFYEGVSTGGNGIAYAADTGFWKDGQVMKINPLTGAVSPFIALDSVPTGPAQREAVIGPTSGAGGDVHYSAIHGTAIDDSGHIFLCDRSHGQIGVYDTAGVFLGAILVKWPDGVTVQPKTGTVFVASRCCTGYYTGIIKLYRFSGWRTPMAQACSLQITTSVNTDSWTDGGKVSLVVSEQGGKTMVWIGYSTIGARIYQDNGASLALVMDFAIQAAGVNLEIDRLAVDRRTEKLYINNGWAGLWQIEDWSNPQMLPCTTSAGRPLNAEDVAISFDGQLYAHDEAGATGGPVHRWSLDHYAAPIPFANSGTNVLTTYVYSRYGANFGDKGMAVAPDKRVGFCYMGSWMWYMVGMIGDSTQRTGVVGTDTIAMGVVDTIIKPLPVTQGGLQFDLQGNLYVGAGARSRDHVTPAGYENDIAYNAGVGAVFKFPAGGKGAIAATTGQTSLSVSRDGEADATGEERVYKPGFAPFSGTSEACFCRSPRFDVDLYGRLFIPNAITQKVAIVDNNDNPIVTFGQYGNWDSQGDGSLVPTATVPLAWPVGAAASDNFVYVTDYGNTRVARVKMNYVLDNIPGIIKLAAEKAGTPSKLVLSSQPNPFNPMSRINISLPSAEQVNLAVYDVSGKLIRTFAAGNLKAGLHHFTWDAKDAAGRSVSAGVYVYKLTAGKQVLMEKAVLAK